MAVDTSVYRRFCGGRPGMSGYVMLGECAMEINHTERCLELNETVRKNFDSINPARLTPHLHADKHLSQKSVVAILKFRRNYLQAVLELMLPMKMHRNINC